ncbi:MAG: spermidine/putrescine ABC transporter permease PotB [Deltaproteobacteria bacterium]|nr:MAG: spermidine/putrescine ABC transporter permease PotB [Deltaproteobacteria bacterium]
MFRNDLFKKLVLCGVVAWLLMFGLAPSLILVITSFLERGTSELVQLGFTLDNYLRLTEPEVLAMMFESIILASTATLLCLLAGYPFSYLMARSPQRLQPFLLLGVMIPFWTNSLIRTYALVMILKADGLLNSLLLSLGLIATPLPIMFTPIAVFIGLVYTLLPFMILPLYAAFSALDFRLVEAGHDLGANRLQVLGKIIIPLTRPGIIAGCILVFLPALGMFFVPDILGGAKTLLLGNFIRDQFLVARDIPMGAATSLTMTLLMGAMLLLYYQAHRRLGHKKLAT